MTRTRKGVVIVESIEVVTFAVVTRPDGTTRIYEGDRVSDVETLKLLVSAVARGGQVTVSIDRKPEREVKRSRLRGKTFKEAVRTLTEEIAHERSIRVA